ncbi:MAG: FecR family protein [Gemmataceae bacterium]|nr:FecR family protein [Gemmata sp.]MDW8196243.1 FecR family protein [Gemmataceae bacterium]
MKSHLASIDELFVRYWDGTLSPEQQDQLADLLASAPAARAQFQLLCHQALAAAELPAWQEPIGSLSAIANQPLVPATPGCPPSPSGWSRRRVLGWVGGGLAAGIAGVAAYRWWGSEAGDPLRLQHVRGTVHLRDSRGRTRSVEKPLPPNATVATIGLESTATLAYPDGTRITLNGDSVILLRGSTRWLHLTQGVVSAVVLPQPLAAAPLVLSTPQVVLPGLSGVALSLGEVARATEVGVHQGVIQAQRPNGDALADFRPGELHVVHADGRHTKEPLPTTPTDYRRDFAEPLPEDWSVGIREWWETDFVVRPEWWPDPYHNFTVMHQIRSDKQWNRGFFTLYPTSEIHVRYWIDRPGAGQLCVCVRTSRTVSSPTGVLEVNDAFVDARSREWQWLKVRAANMLANKEAPRFRDPWVAFLLVFNTYEEDLGLKVAEIRVVGPRPAD